MKSVEQLTRKEIVEAINKDWMTHDGMWFYHCLQAFGMEKTNQINLAAIESMTHAEVYRFKKLIQIEKETIDNLDELEHLFQRFQALFMPDFMGAYLEFKKPDRLRVGMKPDACFAYKGIKKLGAIESYQCGVLFRVDRILKAFGLEFQRSRPLGTCFMHKEGACELDFQFTFG